MKKPKINGVVFGGPDDVAESDPEDGQQPAPPAVHPLNFEVHPDNMRLQGFEAPNGGRMILAIQVTIPIPPGLLKGVEMPLIHIPGSAQGSVVQKVGQAFGNAVAAPLILILPVREDALTEQALERARAAQELEPQG